ncbi:MAG: RdgB/HAM1 family non-canonical purine NTP pyrophosphatase [Stellaceae bacterium]
MAPKESHSLRGQRLVVASHNPGKFAELSSLLKPYGVDAVGAASLGLIEPNETGSSFEENAALKAKVAARASGLPALADDSGLVVPALGGKPGIHSARWAGAARDFAAAMNRLERLMGGLKDRRAFFVAVLALAWPDGRIETFRGEAHGRLVFPPRGARGFGYDPVFLPDGMEETFGEMQPEAKDKISHRAKAFAAFAEAWLGQAP